MTSFFIITAALFFGGGIFILLEAILNHPSQKSRRTVKKSNQPLEEKKLLEKLEPLLLKMAAPLSKLIPLNAYKEREMKVMLDSGGLLYTPKLFIARSICIVFLLSLCSVPLFFLHPFIGLCVMGIGGVVGVQQYAKIYEIEKDRKKIIEAELPRFTQHIALAVQNTNNVTGILEVYRPMAGKTFGKELTKTIADIKTSDVQGSLKRLSRRVNSSMLSEVTRGLCSIDNGIDQGTHFQLLAFTYRDKQNQLFKKEMLKKPDKISNCGFLGLAGVLVQIGVIIGTQLMDTMGTFNL